MELYLLWIHLKERNSNYFMGRKTKPEKLQGLFNTPQQIPNYYTRKKKMQRGVVTELRMVKIRFSLQLL